MSWLISFEGIEGCGKSTQLAQIAQRLQDHGLHPVVTREPGGTELGLRLRQILLDPQSRVAPRAELMLYAADRLQHLEEVIEPALEAGHCVLCDRFIDATLAYQGFGRKLGTTEIVELHQRPPLNRKPDRTILIDLDAELGIQRARERDRRARCTDDEGRFEQEALEFHRRVRQGYLSLAAAEPRRIRVIDGRGSVDQVNERVSQALSDLFPRALS